MHKCCLGWMVMLAACGSSSGSSATSDGDQASDAKIDDATADVPGDADAATPDVVADGANEVGSDLAPADAPPDAASACDVVSTAQALAGAGALDCGHATLFDGQAPVVYDCAVTAMQAGKNVFALLDMQGIDSHITMGLVRTPEGAIGTLQYDDFKGFGTGNTGTIWWHRCKWASFASPAGVKVLTCAGDGTSPKLCPDAAQANTQATQVVQWTPQDQVVYVQPGGGAAKYPPPPTDWTTVRLQEGVGPCPPGQTCAWTWTAQPTGTVIASEAGKDKKLSLAEVQQLWELVGPPSFLASMKSGFACPQPPTDIGYTLQFAVGKDAFSQDVTGCVMGDAEGVPAKIAKLLQN